MIIAAEYSFNRGKEVIETNFPGHLSDIIEVINFVDATICRTKASKEVTMQGKMLYSPLTLKRQNYQKLSRISYV